MIKDDYVKILKIKKRAHFMSPLIFLNVSSIPKIKSTEQIINPATDEKTAKLYMNSKSRTNINASNPDTSVKLY